MSDSLPVLYSFRRCPYAMRARMAIRYSGIPVELREVMLKNKPETMLRASPKATVPVLIDHDRVIDESLDIIFWALQQHDPDHWLEPQQQDQALSLIRQNDNIFKIHLDHYKYFDRFPEHDQLYYRQKGEIFLQALEQRLQQQPFLLGEAGLADIAIFPFIRQFAFVDMPWFETSPYPALRNWLNHWLDSDHFSSIMQKYPAWDENSAPVIF